MNNQTVGMLILLVAKKSNPYEWFITLNHQTEKYYVKQQHQLLECETAVQIARNNNEKLLESIHECVQGIYCLEVG